MPSKTVGFLVLVISTLFGAFLGRKDVGHPAVGYIATAGGLLGGVLLLILMRAWSEPSVRQIIGGAIGLLTSVLLWLLIVLGMAPVLSEYDLPAVIILYALIVFALFGIQIGYAKASEFGKTGTDARGDAPANVGILDTSVIIDGRIADICETGFLVGDLIVPQFVLHELQLIADSPESTKRTRGRRGLDIINKMQKQSSVGIIIDNRDYPAIKEVDQKLIEMAKETGHAILTNDFNLNKVAEVHSLKVLNINQLATALKPLVLPGETMKVQVIKEGKEPGQGVAYLDDGTMIVVDQGRRWMGRTIEVTVTSVLQTTAGRMIFAAMKDH